MKQSPTIECKNITKSFDNGSKRIEVLHGVNLVTYPGELVILMGPSGSGKTTLISIIGGILEQDSGECLVMGKPINQLPEQEKTEFRGDTIGFLFQHFTLIPSLNACENAAIPLLVHGVECEKAFARATKLLDELDLAEQVGKTPDHLSGGEQQRVAITRAYIHKPSVILCDEPTSFLDLERGKKVMEILQSIKDEYQCTVIVITHDPRILSYADRIVEIEDGVIKSQTQENSSPSLEQAVEDSNLE